MVASARLCTPWACRISPVLESPTMTDGRTMTASRPLSRTMCSPDSLEVTYSSGRADGLDSNTPPRSPPWSTCRTTNAVLTCTSSASASAANSTTRPRPSMLSRSTSSCSAVKLTIAAECTTTSISAQSRRYAAGSRPSRGLVRSTCTTRPDPVGSRRYTAETTSYPSNTFSTAVPSTPLAPVRSTVGPDVAPVLGALTRRLRPAGGSGARRRRTRSPAPRTAASPPRRS